MRPRKRDFRIGPAKRGKGAKITAITGGDRLPIAVSVQPASPHESQLIEEAIGHSFLDELPARLIGDKAYDSDESDQQMQEQYGIEMMAPHRSERVHPTQDGRYDAIGDGGRLSVFSLGCKCFADRSRATSTLSKISSECSG